MMDANVKSVNELSSMAATLQDAHDVIVSDCVTITDFLGQKLAELIRLRSLAEEMVGRMNDEYKRVLYDYAETAGRGRNLEQVSAQLYEAERRSSTASYKLHELSKSVTVCQAMVTHIVGETQSFRYDSTRIISSGRDFVRKSSDDLITYLENCSKK